MVDVVVVGAGIAGLSAAREFNNRGLSSIVVERDRHTGGRIQTERRADGYLEHGGIFHTKVYTAMRRMMAELGLADDVAATAGGFYAAVRHHGQWAHLDYGSRLGALRFPVLSWADRASIIKAGLPALLARPTDLGDLTTLEKLDHRSAAHGLTSRCTEYFTAGPHEFLWGTPTRELSYAMLAMQMHVFKGDLLELKGGMGRLIEAVAATVDVRHGQDVLRVAEHSDGVCVQLSDGSQIAARGAVLACPGDVSARLWTDPPPAVAAHLAAVEYSRIDYVYLRTSRPFTRRNNGRLVGIEVIPEPEVGAMTMGGIYYANDWVADGGLLLVTAAPSAKAAGLSDAELAERLEADAVALHPELADLITERVVMRHHPYGPAVAPGAVRRAAAARRALPAGRIDLAGDHMTAPWVEGAIRSGQLAAERLSGALGRLDLSPAPGRAISQRRTQ